MDRIPVASSPIRSVGDDFPNSVLEVELLAGSRVDRHDDVPLPVDNELMAAESKGSSFNESVRDLDPFEEVEPAPGGVDRP